MQNSTNYQMNLPEGFDQFDIAHFNQNTRFLDSKIKSLENETDKIVSTKKKLTGTLSTGQTYVSFQDSAINNNSYIDVYTSVYGVNPRDITLTGNTVIVYFAAQTSAVDVSIVVENYQ